MWSNPILLHRRFGHLDTQLPELPDAPWRPPRQIGPGHVPNQVPDLLGNRGPPGLLTLAPTPPVLAKASLLPGKHGTGLDEH
jgi:hypothetical protein